jgi:hypothetical protein
VVVVVVVVVIDIVDSIMIVVVIDAVMFLIVFPIVVPTSSKFGNRRKSSYGSVGNWRTHYKNTTKNHTHTKSELKYQKETPIQKETI